MGKETDCPEEKSCSYDFKRFKIMVAMNLLVFCLCFDSMKLFQKKFTGLQLFQAIYETFYLYSHHFVMNHTTNTPPAIVYTRRKKQKPLEAAAVQ